MTAEWQRMLFMAVLLAATGAGSCAPSSSLLPTDLIIVTHLSPEAEGSFGQHTVSINQAYANRYGYVFKVVRGEGIVPTDRDARWSKIKILSDLMEADDKRGAVLWMDSDVVFTNFNFTVLSLAQQMVDKNVDLAMCKDLSAPKEASRQTCAPICLNTGTMMMLKTAWTREMLRTWWQAADAHLSVFKNGKDHEESVLASLYSTDEGQIRSKTLLLGPDELNSIPPFHKEHKVEQPVMHLSDTPDFVRNKVLERLVARLITSSDGAVQMDIESLASAISPPHVRTAGYSSPPHVPASHTAATATATTTTSSSGASGSALESLTIQAYRELWGGGGCRDVRVPLVLAATEREGGNTESALALLKRAVAMAPEEVEALLAYGSLLAWSARMQAGREDALRWCEAASVFLRAAQLAPSSDTTGAMLRNANHNCARAKKETLTREKVFNIVRNSLLLCVAGVTLVALLSGAIHTLRRLRGPRAAIKARGPHAATKAQDGAKTKVT